MTTTAKACACTANIKHTRLEETPGRWKGASCEARVTAWVFCPLHAAAEDMRAALGLYVLAVGNTGAIVDPVSVRAAYEVARAALAKAEGKA